MQRQPLRSLPLLLFLSTHPGPSIAVAALCVALGVTTLDVWRIVVVGLAVLLGQFSVGLSNDWLDATRDRVVGRNDKPVASGEISGVLARNAAFITATFGLSLTLLLGWQAAAAHAVFIAAGWSYNLGLKKTVASVVPYLVGFGSLPAVVTYARTAPAPPAWWLMAAAAALGVAAHFANALPDFEDDRATGIVGLPHRLGSRLSSVLTFAALAVAAFVIVLGPGKPVGIVGWSTLIAEGVIIVAGVTLAIRLPPGRPLFRLVILGAVVAVVSLVLSGGQFAVNSFTA